MNYSQLIKSYNTINESSQYITLLKGDFIALKSADSSDNFEGVLYFEVIVFRKETRECYSLWVRTDELEIHAPVSYRVFEDGIPYLFIEQDCELSQMKSVRLQ